MNPKNAILASRARQLAQKRESVEPADIISLVQFGLFPELYAVDVKYVREVLTLSELTPIPGTPPFIMGVIGFRGKITCMLNLKILFGLKEKGLTEFNKVIILSNDKQEFGIVADKIIGLTQIPAGDIKEPPLTLTGIGAEFVSGTTTSGIILLSAEKMLKSEKLIINQ